ncbi:MAG: SDR family NAD(P)-dependent oxidoreductase [Leadbetterella sp.]
MKFENKVALITGAASGIGFEIVVQLCKNGCSVVLNDVNEQLSVLAVEKLKKWVPDANVAICSGDAGEVSFIYDMVDFAVKTFGKLDYVIANAGITLFGSFLEFTPENFDKIYHVNLFGSFFLTQAFAKYCLKTGHKGNVILMSSNIGYQAYPNLSAYAVTKAGIKMMARNLVAELSPLGIRINAIAPGATLTERTSVEENDYWGVWSKITPLNQIATPEDIAQTAMFLLSNDSKHITGQTMVVDGGWELAGARPN